MFSPPWTKIRIPVGTNQLVKSLKRALASFAFYVILIFVSLVNCLLVFFGTLELGGQARVREEAAQPLILCVLLFRSPSPGPLFFPPEAFLLWLISSNNVNSTLVLFPPLPNVPFGWYLLHPRRCAFRHKQFSPPWDRILPSVALPLGSFYGPFRPTPSVEEGSFLDYYPVFEPLPDTFPGHTALRCSHSAYRSSPLSLPLEKYF